MRRAMVVARAAPGMARVPGATRRADRLRPAALATGGAARMARLACRRACGRAAQLRAEPAAVRRTDPALPRRPIRTARAPRRAL
jgi:hypothetical protein